MGLGVQFLKEMKEEENLIKTCFTHFIEKEKF